MNVYRQTPPLQKTWEEYKKLVYADKDYLTQIMTYNRLKAEAKEYGLIFKCPYPVPIPPSSPYYWE